VALTPVTWAGWRPAVPGLLSARGVLAASNGGPFEEERLWVILPSVTVTHSAPGALFTARSGCVVHDQRGLVVTEGGDHLRAGEDLHERA